MNRPLHSLTGRNISFIYVWMLSQPCLNTQFQLLSAAIQLPSEIAKKFIHVWILFTQLNLTIQLSYAWHRLFMQLILRRVNWFSACCTISCETSRHQRISLLFHTSLDGCLTKLKSTVKLKGLTILPIKSDQSAKKWYSWTQGSAMTHTHPFLLLSATPLPPIMLWSSSSSL